MLACPIIGVLQCPSRASENVLAVYSRFSLFMVLPAMYLSDLSSFSQHVFIYQPMNKITINSFSQTGA